MAFDKRESFENNQKFNIIPTPDDANTRNFHVESVRLPGYYLQVAQDGNNNSKDAQMQIFNNQFQRWNLKYVILNFTSLSKMCMNLSRI